MLVYLLTVTVYLPTNRVSLPARPNCFFTSQPYLLLYPNTRNHKEEKREMGLLGFFPPGVFVTALPKRLSQPSAASCPGASVTAQHAEQHTLRKRAIYQLCLELSGETWRNDSNNKRGHP